MARPARRNLPFPCRPVSRTPGSQGARRSSKAPQSFQLPGFRNVDMRLRGSKRGEPPGITGVDEEDTMTLTTAALLANVLNFVMFAMISIWYVAPWLARLRRADAFAALLWVNAFRDIALQIFSAQHFGVAVSDMTRDVIVAGDLIGMALALGAITALRYGAPIALLLVWAFIAETAFDLVYTSYLGVREQL